MPAGFFAPAGSSAAQPCAAGSFSAAAGAALCAPCPPRFVCPAQSSAPAVCGKGLFCAGGVAPGAEGRCPLGFFSNATGLASASECARCLPGSWCGSTGLTAPSGPCAAGSLCFGGAATAAPRDGGLTGDACPAGAYCVAGSSSPALCPPGTLNGAAGGTALLASCAPCDAGFSCPQPGTVVATQPCAASFYCPGGDATPTLLCPPGSSCAVGSAAPQPCAAGTYAPAGGAAACLQCPQRFLCAAAGGTVSPAPCPAGGWCAAGSGTPAPCPIGTASNRTGLASAIECAACVAGSFCGSPGLTAPSGLCGPGYFCNGGALVPRPSDGGLTGGPCSAGFVCTNGSTSAVPSIPSTGYACPAGSFCLAGATAPQACPGGSHQPSTGASSCLPCRECCRARSSACVRAISPQFAPLLLSARPFPPSFLPYLAAGTFCAGGNVAPVTCPASFVCGPSTTVPVPCADGSWGGPLAPTGLSEQSQCASCIPGVSAAYPDSSSRARTL